MINVDQKEVINLNYLLLSSSKQNGINDLNSDICFNTKASRNCVSHLKH